MEGDIRLIHNFIFMALRSNFRAGRVVARFLSSLDMFLKRNLTKLSLINFFLISIWGVVYLLFRTRFPGYLVLEKIGACSFYSDLPCVTSL